MLDFIKSSSGKQLETPLPSMHIAKVEQIAHVCIQQCSLTAERYPGMQCHVVPDETNGSDVTVITIC